VIRDKLKKVKTMPVKIRLARRGRKKLAIYDIVVADSRSPRDGKFIEKLGLFNPNVHPALVTLNADKAFKWIMNGAVPTDTAKALLSAEGVLIRKHLQIGVLKGAITQEQADKKFDEWKAQKEKSKASASSSLVTKKEEEKSSRLAAESKVAEARRESIKKKNTVETALEVADENAESIETSEAPASSEDEETQA
jgi:small subunit ribosomal protein S16